MLHRVESLFDLPPGSLLANDLFQKNKTTTGTFLSAMELIGTDIYPSIVGLCHSIEVWLSVPLHISRKRVHLVALGVCSYVAASCGGALGRLCLTTGEEQDDKEEEFLVGCFFV